MYRSFIVSVQVCIFTLNMRDITIYVARWWEKHLSKHSLIKHTRNIFLQKLCQKWGREISSRHFFFNKLNMRWKQVICSLVSIYFDSPQPVINKSKLYKTLDCWSRNMLNFQFSGTGLGLVSPPHFANDFSWKMFLILYSINWPNFSVWLPLLHEILSNMCITIVCQSGCDVIKFEINIIFLIKPFWSKS